MLLNGLSFVINAHLHILLHCCRAVYHDFHLLYANVLGVSSASFVKAIGEGLVRLLDPETM